MKHYEAWRAETHERLTETQVQAYVAAAKRLYANPDRVQVDDNAVVSHGVDGGAYVLAWVWVPKKHAEAPDA